MSRYDRRLVDGLDGSGRVLHVGSDPAFRERTATALGRHAPGVTVTAAGRDEALASLDAADCVLVSTPGDGADGVDLVDLVETVRARGPSLPVVVAVDPDRPSTVDAAIEAGATDVVDVDAPGRLLAARLARATSGSPDGASGADGPDAADAAAPPSVTGVDATDPPVRPVAAADDDDPDRLRAELTATQQSLRRLYDVATDRDRSLDERIERTLEVGCERLGTSLGFLTRISDGRQRIVHAVGDHPLLQRGEACPLEESYCRRTIESEGLLAVVHAATDERWVDDHAYETFGLECYLGGTVAVDGERYGTLCFADTEPREGPFSRSEATFVELLTRWTSYELERRQHERDLRTANRRFRALFENPRTFAGVLDPDGTLREVNDTAAATLEGDPEAVLGRPFWETPWWEPLPEAAETVREAVETAAAGRTASFECAYARDDGEGTVSATVYPVTADPGDGDDADAAPASDPTPGLLDPAGAALNGTPPHEGAASQSGEAAESVLSLMIVGTDTTRRTEQAAELRRERDRLEEFASVVSHDLRSPLEVARGRLHLYEQTGDDSHLDDVASSLDRISTLIEDLLALARQGRSVADPVPTEPASVARQAWSSVRTDGATLVVDLDPDLTVAADPSRLQQLFENLFRNAVEHGSTGPRSPAHEDAVEHGSTSPRSQARGDAVEHGSTSPRSEAHEDAVEHGSTDGRPAVDDEFVRGADDPAADDEFVRGADDPAADATDGVTVRLVGLDDGRGFAVEDDGPGVPPAEREQVFDRGFSTATDGTGFGLAIVRRVAEAHGWSVAVEESAAGGARFEVRTGSGE